MNDPSLTWPAIDVAHPDPAGGDPVPDHVFWAPMAEPLGAVLRPDRVPRLRPLHPAPPRRSRLSAIWHDHHEWVVAAVIIFAAIVVTIAQN